jgi:2-haloacid dehalogenase
MQYNFEQPKVIVFDVNETLLNMRTVKKKVNALLACKQGYRIWFGLLLQYSLVDTVTRSYHDFGLIAGATLHMAAHELGTTVSDEEEKAILNTMKEVAPYKEVEDGLARLVHAGYRLVAFTNSPAATLQYQLQATGLAKYFEAAISVDEFRHYKPDNEVYGKALAKVSVPPQQAMMVAAHGWDIAGALKAGMQAAFIQRKGQSLYPLAPAPQLIAKNIKAFANQLIGDKQEKVLNEPEV